MTRLTLEQTEFIQRTGHVLASNGMPRIGAEVVALLIITPEALSTDEIAEALRVSRAAVGTNIRLLESAEIVVRAPRHGERCVTYGLSDDPFGKVVARMSARMSELAAAAAEARGRITDPVARERLTRMDRFFTLAKRNADRVLEQWRHA